MNKLFSRIAALSVGLAMAVGVGVALGHQSVKVAKAAEYSAYKLDGSVVTAVSGDPTYSNDSNYNNESVATQNELSWKVVGNTTMNPWRIGGKGAKNKVTYTYDRTIASQAAVSSENISKVEVSIGTISTSNFAINSFTMNVSTAVDGGGTIESSLTGTLSASSVTTFTRPDGKDWSNKYFQFVANVSCTGTASGASNVYFTLNEIVFKYDVSVVNPDAVTVSGESATSVGESITLSALATISGSSTGVNQNVVWSSLDETKAIVSSSGVVTGVANGIVTIRATAAEVSSVYGEYSVTVSGGKTDDSAVIFTTADTNFGGYGNYSVARHGVFMHFKQAATMSNGGSQQIQLQSSNGLIENISAMPEEITRVELDISSESNGTGYKVYASADGETYSEVSSTLLYENKFVYTVSSGNYFFKLQAGSNTLRLNDLLIGLGNSTEEKMNALASSMNDILDAECTGEEDSVALPASKWEEVEAVYTGYAHEDAKTALAAVTGLSYVEVNQFLERYDHIVSAYGYSNFLERDVPAQAHMIGFEHNNNSYIIIIVISAVSVMSFGLALFLRKKRSK